MSKKATPTSVPSSPLWSPYQTAIFAHAAGSGSGCINAVAGSGKTTTAVEAAKRGQGQDQDLCHGQDQLLSQPVERSSSSTPLFLTFNKRIADAIPSARTFNSLGHRAWAKATGRRLRVDTRKIGKIIQDGKFAADFMDILTAVNAARMAGIVPVQGIPGLRPDTPEAWERLAPDYDTASSARSVLITSIAQARAGVIDFQDQVYMSALFGAPIEPHGLVFVDEAQDLDPLQHRLLARVAPERLYIVGDPHQACYGFRGAKLNSMAVLTAARGLDQLPLSISYRCGKSIVAEAQQYVPHIEPWADAPDGVVERVESVSDAISPGTHIVCRYNAPLFRLAWSLITSGTGANIIGRDITTGLRRLIKRLAPERLPMPLFTSRLLAWAADQISRGKNEGHIADQVDCLRAIGATDTVDLVTKLSLMFSGTGVVTLSSIHRAKGLEWDHVVFYGPELLPSKYAGTPSELAQEDNLAYIAITRAKRRLTYSPIR